MLAMAQSFDVVLDIITYNTANSACEKSTKWQQALVLLAKARGAGSLLHVITYNAAVSAGEKGKQWQQALYLLTAVRSNDFSPKTSPLARQSVRVRGASNGSRHLVCCQRCTSYDVFLDVIPYTVAISICEKLSNGSRQWVCWQRREVLMCSSKLLPTMLQ